MNRAAIRAGNNCLQDGGRKLSTGVPRLLSCQTVKMVNLKSRYFFGGTDIQLLNVLVYLLVVLCHFLSCDHLLPNILS